MLRIVLDDYRYNFKSVLKELKYEGWFGYLYLLIFPLLSNDIIMDKAVIYYGTVISMLLGLFIAKLYPNRMSKTLFLCPMSKEARIQYFKTAFCFRISVPILVFLAVCGVLLFCEILPGLLFLTMLAVVIMFVISVNIYMVPEDDNVEVLSRHYSLPGYFPMWHVLAQISGMINAAIIGEFSEYDGMSYSIWDTVMTGILLLIQLLVLLKIVCTYLKPVMEQSVNYETSYANINHREEKH